MPPPQKKGGNQDGVYMMIGEGGDEKKKKKAWIDHPESPLTNKVIIMDQWIYGAGKRSRDAASLVEASVWAISTRLGCKSR